MFALVVIAVVGLFVWTLVEDDASEGSHADAQLTRVSRQDIL